MDRFFTFLYVRSGNAGVRSIRIHKKTAFAVAGVLLAFIGTVTGLGVRYSGVIVNSARLAELESENQRLTGRIRDFQMEIEGLRKGMEVSFELQNRARLMANLDPVNEDVWQVGIGGPQPVYLKKELGAADRVFSAMEDDLDRIVRQSALQKESYRELLDILEKESDRRDCTPSIRPLKGGFLSSRYGRRMDPFTGRVGMHKGVDYFARTGTPVFATADGIVTMAKKNGSMGLMVEVDHGNGFKTRYAHLSKMLVKRGKRIKRGEALGLVGNTGRSSGPHLHYEVKFRKDNRDPLQYIIPEDVYYD
ncbi:MAG TPA: peptidoglycan DD-metalloendopeptidase family protein [Candidatus Krumholzibacterium sp.]|nr:peptidoglycan DD-metalloendopeptidase family protein [Candidatus Krumholzibacterium sp.]